MLLVLARYVAHIVCDLETLQSSCEFRIKWHWETKKEMNDISACILYLVKNNNNQLAIYFTSLDKGSTSGW